MTFSQVILRNDERFIILFTKNTKPERYYLFFQLEILKKKKKIGKLSGKNCSGFGSGLSQTICGVEARFTIQLKDQHGNPWNAKHANNQYLILMILILKKDLLI